MADWPLLQKSQIAESSIVDYNSLSGIQADGGVNTKGSYVELISSSSYDAYGILLHIQTEYLISSDILFDIAVGSSGSEVVIIPDVLAGCPYSNADFSSGSIFIPISIPSGSRISARCQASTGSPYAKVGFHLLCGDLSQGLGNKMVTYGAETTNSGGTAIDPGGTASTKGSYAELTASCENIKGFFLSIGSRANTGRTDAYWRLDVAIGAPGSEIVILPDFPLAANAVSDHVLPKFSPFIPIGIPDGSRISARAQCNITDSSDRLFDLVLHGLL